MIKDSVSYAIIRVCYNVLVIIKTYTYYNLNTITHQCTMLPLMDYMK